MLPGLNGVSEMVVADEDLVSRLGGVPIHVLSTPRLVQLLEAAAVEAIKEYLHDNQVSLGIRVNIRHLAATPLGMKVTAHALLTSVEKNRLLFIVNAHDQKEKVAEGEHERVLVPMDRFLQRLEEKKIGKSEA